MRVFQWEIDLNWISLKIDENRREISKMTFNFENDLNIMNDFNRKMILKVRIKTEIHLQFIKFTTKNLR